MSVKITRLEAENVKRVKAVALEPSAQGLTIIGGRNEQGKTSVLDAIAWALGGDRFKPDEPKREGSATPPKLRVELSNGLVVERKGTASALKVIDPKGNKGGQQLLNEFVEAFALDVPRFMNQNGKDKAKTVLQIAGVGERLYELEAEESRLYNERHTLGQIAEQKKGAAEEATWYPDAPAEPVSVADLVKQQQDILATNGENQRKRESVDVLKARQLILSKDITDLKSRLHDMEQEFYKNEGDLATAMKTAEQLEDESTAEIEQSIAAIEETNEKVRANQAKSILDDEANELKGRYDELSAKVDAVRAEKLALLDGADLPLEGLSVADGELTYQGRKWGDMSSSGQLKVATAIVRKLNPECGFVLIDKLEQMDLDTLTEFGAWLTSEGLQVIATRVSTGGECSIVVEDGYVAATEASEQSWKPGEF